MRVVVVGQGYVGLTAAVGLADAGHEVTGVEVRADRLDALRSRTPPFYEPGLGEALSRLVGNGRLGFARSVAEVPGPAQAVVVAVGTPPLPSGGCDLGQVSRALDEVLAMPPLPELLLLKSTVPPGTSRQLLRRSGDAASLRERYVYSPEFLNQGTALREWRNPSRTVFGAWNEDLLPAVEELYRGVGGPRIVTTPTNAEMIKYASNAFLATKTSFINEIANACEHVGADVDRIVEGISLDPRIGEAFWKVGGGYGDSCLSKDVRALTFSSNADGHAMRLLETVEAINEAQRLRPLQIVRECLAQEPSARPTIAVLGLNFEPHSDDTAHVASLVLIPEFLKLAAEVRVWDPLLSESQVAALFPEASRQATIEEAVAGAGIVVILTHFAQVVQAEWKALATRITAPGLVVDSKNCLRPEEVVQAGLGYRGIGRGQEEMVGQLVARSTS